MTHLGSGTGSVFHGVGADVWYAWRLVCRERVFTAAAVLTLALGIGANTAIFSVVNAVLLRPLPYPDSDRLVALNVRHPAHGLFDVSLHDYEDWRDRTRAFADMGVYNVRGGTMRGLAEPLRIQYALVTPSLLTTLLVRPAHGRSFETEENLPGADHVAIIGHALWQQAFGSRPDVVGRIVTLNDVRLTIVGVMPAGFAFPDSSVQLWKPFGMRPDDSGTREGRWVKAVARLPDGVTLDQARTDLEGIVAALGRQYPDTNGHLTAVVQPLLETVAGHARRALVLLSAAVGLLLLIACANVANLMLARASARQRDEIAIRLALGASRWRIVRLLLVQSLLLSAIGTLAGLFLGTRMTTLLPRLSDGSIPRIDQVALDPRVLLFTVTLSVVAGLAFGTVPAIAAAAYAPGAALRPVRRSVRGGGRTRGLLVVAEVALAFVVVASAGVLGRSLVRALAVSPGFDVERLLTFRIEPPWRTDHTSVADEQELRRQLDAERVASAAFFDDLLARIATVPGVRSAAAVNRRPLAGSWWVSGLDVFARTYGTEQERPDAMVRVVTPRYFEAMRIPLQRGRVLDVSDDGRAARVAVVSEALERAVWPGQGALGQRIRLGPGDWHEIVGVVHDVKQTRLEDRDWPTIYFAFAQAPWGHFGDWGMDIVIRTAGAPLDLARDVRAQVRIAAPDLAITGMSAMADAVGETVADRRSHTLLLGLFGLVSATLASVGLAGLLTVIVGERAPEIGVRSALGATPADVARLVIGEGIRLTLAGLASGAVLAAIAARALRGFVFGITASDPATLTTAAILLAAVALAACGFPVAQALRFDPVRALRQNV